MLGKYSRWMHIGLMLVSLATAMAAEAQASTHPLAPGDLSSPRATLDAFLKTGDELLLVVRGEHWNTPSRAVAHQILHLDTEMQHMLDLSKVPPAARFAVGRDAAINLYEVLSRIELPPVDLIPSVSDYAETAKNGKIVRWTIPFTEITIERIPSGPRVGEFVFSPATVARSREFYEITRMLPYRRNVPVKNYAEMRPYLTPEGWLIPSRILFGLPGWLKQSVLEVAVWKWIALALVGAFYVATVWAIHYLAQRLLSAHTGRIATQLRELATPLTLLVLTSPLESAVDQQLTLEGWIAEGLSMVAASVTFFSLAWIAWTGSAAVGELVVASSKAGEQSLSAHLTRLVARAVGLGIVIALIFYISSRLGAPLYSLVTGLGIGGVAFALAAQSSVENFIGSLSLFADHPVRVGDVCAYGEDPTSECLPIGIVESIGLRSTRIRRFDHTIAAIPNGVFAKMHIVNYSTRDRILFKSTLHLRNDITDAQLRCVLVELRKMLLAHPRVLGEEPLVRFAGFGEFSLNVDIKVDIGTADGKEFLAIREDICLRIMKIVKDTGTPLAFPSRTLYYSRDTGLDAERQQDAEAKVREWSAARQLPFPRFSADYREKMRNTLDYPPEGSPEAGA